MVVLILRPWITTLCQAVFCQRADIVRLLLDDGRAEPDCEDNCPIRSAASSGCMEIVMMLLADSRVDPSARDGEALAEALKNGHGAIADLLLP